MNPLYFLIAERAHVVNGETIEDCYKTALLVYV
jgi:hypothetical protein